MLIGLGSYWSLLKCHCYGKEIWVRFPNSSEPFLTAVREISIYFKLDPYNLITIIDVSISATWKTNMEQYHISASGMKEAIGCLFGCNKTIVFLISWKCNKIKKTSGLIKRAYWADGRKNIFSYSQWSK